MFLPIGPYSSFCLKTRFWERNDKKLITSVLQQIRLSCFEDKHYRLKEISRQKLIFIQCQFMELSNLVLVAKVTALLYQQKLLQVLLRSLHPSTKSKLQGFNDTWNYLELCYQIKMPPLHPRTSFSSNKLGNSNKGRWLENALLYESYRKVVGSCSENLSNFIKCPFL